MLRRILVPAGQSCDEKPTQVGIVVAPLVHTGLQTKKGKLQGILDSLLGDCTSLFRQEIEVDLMLKSP